MKNNTSKVSNDTPTNTEKLNSKKTQKSNTEEKQIDHNSPNSEYFKYDTYSSHHQKKHEEKYVYEHDTITEKK